MKGRKRGGFVGQFAWIAGGRLFAALLQAGTLALAARLMEPAEFGVIGAVLGVATVLQTGVDLGVPTLILRERAKDPRSPIVGSALRLNNLTTVWLTLLGAALVAAGASLYSETYWALLPLAVWAAAERNADTRVGVAIADGRASISVINVVARRILALTTFVVLVLVGGDPVLALSSALAFAAVASSVWANVYVRRRVEPSSYPFRSVLREAWPFWLNSAATQARNLDAAIVGIAGGATAAGFYSTASRLTVPLRILPTSMATALIPASVKAIRVGSSLKPLGRAVIVTVGGMTVVYAGLFIITPFIVPFALGDAYAGSVPVVQIVVAGLPFAAVASLLSALLQGVGDKHFVSGTALATTAICLTSVLIGVGLGGAEGAAYGLSASFLVQAAILVLRMPTAIRRGKANEKE